MYNGKFHTEIMYKLGEISSDIKSINSRLEETKDTLKTQSIDIQSLKTYQDNQKGQITILSIVWGSISALIIGWFEYFAFKK